LEIASTITRNLPAQVRAKPTTVGFGLLSRRIYSATSPYPNFFLEIHEIASTTIRKLPAQVSGKADDSRLWVIVATNLFGNIALRPPT
jgi:hypothetical protein